MRVKNAIYVEKNIELNQEFFFAHQVTKLTMNKIYNPHYSGSPLWNLFGVGARRIESSFNRSVKIMLDLPYPTHRYLIEPLTGEKHMNKVLISRYLGFMEKIGSSNKRAIKMLMEIARKDVRSITGQNYRNIMLLVGKSSVEDVKKEDVEKIENFTVDETDVWRIDIIKEIINVKSSNLDISNFELEEIEEILTDLDDGPFLLLLFLKFSRGFSCSSK